MAPDRAAAHKPDIRPLAPPLLWPLGAQGLRRPRRARGGPLGRAPTGRAPPPRPRSSPAAPGCASPGIVPRVPGRGRGHFREGRFPASPAPRQGGPGTRSGAKAPRPSRAGGEAGPLRPGAAWLSGLLGAFPRWPPRRQPVTAFDTWLSAPLPSPRPQAVPASPVGSAPSPAPRPPPWSARRGLRALARPLQLAALFSCGLPSTARPPDCPVWSPRASCGC